MAFSTPVLFLIFNRPDKTQKVFDAIKKIQPARFYVAADGPRANNEKEALQCEMARKIVLKGINWKGEVCTLIRNENLGCGLAVSQAITWFFDNVEEGIILEDDCLVDENFFNFCTELLEKFRNSKQIMHIGGANFQKASKVIGSSYYFSNYIHIWGWATWRRAWKFYNFQLQNVSGTKFEHMLKVKFSNKFEHIFWRDTFNSMSQSKIDTWDIQWVHAIYANNGIGITPEVNLVSNIGFGADATHTSDQGNGVADIPIRKIGQISHPTKIKINYTADKYSFKKLFGHGNNQFNHIKFLIGRYIPWIKGLYLIIVKKRSINQPEL